MPNRLKSTFWTKTVRRQIGAFTRNALRASNRLVKAATPRRAKVSKARRSTRAPKAVLLHKPSATTGEAMKAAIAVGPAGAKRYYVARSPGRATAPKLGLVVMLHGCGQDAHTFAASTRMNRLAAAAGCMVLYPEQDRMANAHGCWNWFDTRSRRAQREAAGIVSAIDQVCATYPINARHIAVVGLSAGAGMAALLALHYPQRFAAVVMHSGVGPGLAHSSATALAAMRGHSASAGTALPSAVLGNQLPALLVIQGNKDRVVAPVNAGLAAQRWAATMGAKPSAPRVVQRGARYAATVTDWTLGRRVVATWVQVAGLGHAWSGGSAAQPYSDPAGPDASRMVLAFAQRAFVQRDSDAAAGTRMPLSSHTLHHP